MRTLGDNDDILGNLPVNKVIPKIWLLRGKLRNERVNQTSGGGQEHIRILKLVKQT